ncbi:MAG: FAD-binding domain-containing protein [Ilumatobacteraceae bacterium]
MSTRRLPTPGPGRAAAVAWVVDHLVDLALEGDRVAGSERFSGGQSVADAALAAFDVAGYAERRNQVLPTSDRGASGLSPYIRHGLLTLRTVWNHVGGGPGRDVAKFRDELLWQEYARHWYLHHGTVTARGVRREQAEVDPVASWDRSMACVEATLGELDRDGWLVNQTRMWLASDWAVRRDGAWQSGEEHFFRHLLDGSRAANRLGWQWTVGVGSAKHYGFSRSQVERRAPELCRGCVHRAACPITDWPDEPMWAPVGEPAAAPPGVDPGPSAGVDATGEQPDAVWLTAESLGDDDPALAAHPDLPVVFVFDEVLLARLRLSSKRLVFLAETLADLATRREVEVHRGSPGEVLRGRPVSVTFAPVPGFARMRRLVEPVEVHPYPWLVVPRPGRIGSFSAWRRRI